MPLPKAPNRMGQMLDIAEASTQKAQPPAKARTRARSADKAVKTAAADKAVHAEAATEARVLTDTGRAGQRHDEERERSGGQRMRRIETASAGNQRDGENRKRGGDDHGGLEGAGCAAPGQIGRSEAEHACADEQARQNETFVTLPFRRVRLHRCMHQCRRLCPQCCHRHTERNALLSRIPPSAWRISPWSV